MNHSSPAHALLKDLEERYDTQQEKIIADWFTFLRFPSISTDSAYASSVLACAGWLENRLKQMGFTVERWEGPGYPVLFASHCKAGADKPTVLLYNHYDVQPVDPLELWTSPPFEPEIRDGEVYARGAVDNKGQCWYVVEALRLLLERDGTLPVNVKLCIEGEEESGGETLHSVVRKKKKELKADHLLVVDAGFHEADAPVVNLGARGMTAFEVEVTGSNTDLHSGVHGGVAYNPLHALVELFAKVRKPDGSIAIPGFYDDIEQLSPEEKKALDLSFDAAAYTRTFAATPNGGENAYPPGESVVLRPTFEINGLWGGYTGQGFKTVIPAKAYAKISCRLVPGQDPENIEKIVRNFLKEHIVSGMDIKVTRAHDGAKAARTKAGSTTATAVAAAYATIAGKPCHFALEGGSIPITTELAEASGADFVLIGYGLPTDQIHAPNEHFGLDRLRHGALTIALALHNLGN